MPDGIATAVGIGTGIGGMLTAVDGMDGTVGIAGIGGTAIAIPPPTTPPLPPESMFQNAAGSIGPGGGPGGRVIHLSTFRLSLAPCVG